MHKLGISSDLRADLEAEGIQVQGQTVDVSSHCVLNEPENTQRNGDVTSLTQTFDDVCSSQLPVDFEDSSGSDVDDDVILSASEALRRLQQHRVAKASRTGSTTKSVSKAEGTITDKNLKLEHSNENISKNVIDSDNSNVFQQCPPADLSVQSLRVRDESRNIDPLTTSHEALLQNSDKLSQASNQEPLDTELTAEDAKQSLAINMIVQPAIRHLLLDISTLISYVSNLCHGHCDLVFEEPILTQQAAQERRCPLLPVLDRHFEGILFFVPPKQMNLNCCNNFLRTLQVGHY